MILPFLIAWLAGRINRHQDQVIRYLREESRILKAKLKGKRMQLTDTERRRLAVLAHPIERQHLKDVATIATADTLQRWYRCLVVQAPQLTPQGKRLGRPRVATDIEQLTVRMATENPTWGYRRIQGALSNVGYRIDKSTVRNILRRNHIDPAPIRGRAGMSWCQFVKLHWEVLKASGFCEELEAALSRTWTITRQPLHILMALPAQVASIIRRGSGGLQSVLVHSVYARWAGVRVLPAQRDVRAAGEHGQLCERAFPRLHLVSVPTRELPLQARSMVPERSPPGARQITSQPA